MFSVHSTLCGLPTFKVRNYNCIKYNNSIIDFK